MKKAKQMATAIRVTLLVRTCWFSLKGEHQHKLINGEPADTDGRIRYRRAHPIWALWRGIKPVYFKTGDGDERERPHHTHNSAGDTGCPDMVKAEWVDGSHVTVQGHDGKNVGAHCLAVRI